jgi:probable O-glycosylation ligase (exosortase A-associated)
MLRIIFVFSIVIVGMVQACRRGFWALLFYLWMAYFRPQEWVHNGAILDTLNLSLVGGGILLLRTPGSGAKHRFDLRVCLLFLFLLISLASTLVSPYFAYAWPYFVEFLKVVVITYLISAYGAELDRFRQIVLVIAFSLGFEGAKQGWVQLLTNPGATNSNPFTLLGDNNGVAVGMLMLVGLFIALANTAIDRRERAVHYFFAIGVAYRAISTYSRGGFLSLGVLACVYVARSKHRLRAMVSVAVLLAVILPILPQSFWDRMSTIQVTEEDLQKEGDASSLSRLHFWRVAVRMAAANPLMGVGFNAYNKAFNKFDFSLGFYGKGRSVHSSWFGTLAETGYLGFAVYLAILILAIMATFQVMRLAKKGHAPPDLYHYALALQCGFAVFVVGGSFVPWQYCEMLWHFVGLSMGLRALAYATASKTAAVAPALSFGSALQPFPRST